MTTVTLTVSLNTKNNQTYLAVSGSGNQIDHGQSVTIRWQLSGNAATGSFNSQSATNPGFQWLENPPAGVFGTPTPNGNQLTITDDNNKTDSAGTWGYKLWATVNGTQYNSDIPPGPERTMGNPTIQNK